jgi:hypothetical protein
MFLACGIDLCEDPCPVVILDKTGVVLQTWYEERDPDMMAESLYDYGESQGKVLFCALTDESARDFPAFVKAMMKEELLIKTYDFVDVLRMKNILRDTRTDLPLMAYCLAKLVQDEALDLCTYRETLRDISKIRQTLARVELFLTTLHAFPDEYHLMHPE